MIFYRSVANSKTSHWLTAESQVLATVKGYRGYMDFDHEQHRKHPICVPVLTRPVDLPLPLSFPLLYSVGLERRIGLDLRVSVICGYASLPKVLILVGIIRIGTGYFPT